MSVLIDFVIISLLICYGLVQVGKVQSDFQNCQQNVWEELSALQEKKHQEKNKRMGIDEEETKDIVEEENRNGQYWFI